MTKPSTATAALPDWGTVLGITQPRDVDWGGVRAAQINVIRRLAPLRFVSSLLGIAALVFILRGRAPTFELYGWGLLSAFIAALVVHGKLRNSKWEIQTATQAEFHRETIWSTCVGISWGAAPLLFGRYCGPSELLVIWAACTVLMAAAAFALSALPLATCFYLIVMGASLALTMWQLHYDLVAVIAAIFAVGLSGACLIAGRNYILHEAAELALAEKNEVVSLLLREFDDSGGDWMWQTDASKCLTHVSPRFAYALGVDSEALEAKPLLQILAAEAWDAGNFSAGLRELAERLKKRESFSDLILPVTIGTEVHWWELSASPRYDDRGGFLGFRGVGSDVTAQRRSADKINHMARYDTLTGLPNRLQVTEALGEAMTEAERWRGKCAFLMIDLDRFKAINDTLGHPIGDRLLTRVAERLRGLVGEKQTCGRLGGDEFGVVVPDAGDSAALLKLAQQIIETLSRPYEVDQHTLYIGASVGSAIGPRDGRTVETLIRSADLALYRSKDQGGAAHNAYEPQLHVHAEERRVLEIALRKALERNEFLLHYQPVVAADGGAIESFEALLRWNNPELGSVSPMRFVPVAEDARLIGPIGEWVLRTACTEAMRWPDTVRLAVNVSAEQLSDANFVTAVVSALSHSRLPAHRLELEVTESVFLREGNGALQVLEQLLRLGVSLALDDFGTGYSSLGYLSKTRFNTIKIDRSFVQGAAKNAREALAIIRAVVAMADSLGMSTTAEGVETEAEYEMVRRLGCRKVQGYLFGRPMPAPEARRLFDIDRAVA
ncbi:MAG: EAL domain-containing protein [Sphingomonadaceae bacterium]|nr:EAL domain-containing protein [Sphingomonadaceae bacterium]